MFLNVQRNATMPNADINQSYRSQLLQSLNVLVVQWFSVVFWAKYISQAKCFKG